MAISDKITSMTNHLTADYDAIESVVGEVTVNKNIENIAPLLDNLWEELPHTTGSGTELTINDTRAGKMKVQLMGNTSQTQKTGKNLLNIQTSSSSQFGITVTKNSDGTLTVNGTATADAAVIFNTTVTLAAGTYTLSGCPSGGSSSTYNLNLDQLSTMRDNGSGVTFTLNSERTSTAYVSVKSGVTMNNVIFKPMIVSGSTSGDFEPYTGKKTTPNPDNPEQVHTCSGDNEVVVTGKNLFVKSSVIEDEKYLDDGTISTDSSYCRSPLYMNVNGVSNLTISGSNSSSNGKVIIYDENKNFIDYWSTRNRTITIPNNSYYIRISVEKAYKDTLQVEVGDTATSYSDESSTYPIHLGEYEFCNIGDYKDKPIRNSGKNVINLKYKNNVADLVPGNDLTNTEISLPLTSAVGKTYITTGGYFKKGTYTLTNYSATYLSFNRIAIAGTTCVTSTTHLRNSYTWTQTVDGYTYFGLEGDAGETSYTDTQIVVFRETYRKISMYW